MPLAIHPRRLPTLAALTMLLTGLLGGCAFCPAPPPPPTAPPARIAAWVVRSEIDSPAKIERLCATAKTAGFDELLVQVRGRADAYYQSRLAPRAEELSGQAAEFDPLAALITACAPLTIHAWLNVYYLWGGDTPPTDPDHPGQPDRTWLLANADGLSTAAHTPLERAQGWLDGAFADPADPAYRRLFVAVAREVAENYPVAGIHLDFVRYPGPAYGQSGPLGRRFAAAWGVDPALLAMELAPQTVTDWLQDELPPTDRLLTTAALLWAALRADQINQLVTAVAAEFQAPERPAGPLLSAAVFPDPADAIFSRGQEWPHWLAAGLVDRVYPMTYFGETERVAAQLAQIARFQPGRSQAWAGLGAYLKNPERIGREAAAARRAGYSDLALFSLGHLMRKPEGAEAYLRAIRETIRDKGVSAANSQSPPANLARPLPKTTTAAPANADQELPRLARHRAESRLSRLLRQALEPTTASLAPQELTAIITKRLTEFENARPLMADALRQLRAETPQPAPAWVEMREFFRFSHPLDPPGRRQAQLAECEETRQQILAGADFSALAQARSQGGSRRFGGLLPRRPLDPANPADRLLAGLQPGQISPVQLADDGCRIHQIQSKSPGEVLAWDALPPAARRLRFKEKLAELLR